MSERSAILDQIPDPATIRSMITEKIREASLLRGLLRIAERQQRLKSPGRDTRLKGVRRGR
jgi:hypothetical protein